MFRDHHYLSAEFNVAAEVYVACIDDSPVAFFSTLPLPSGCTKFGYRAHRIVILPDYQGLGIGTKLLDFFGNYFLSRGDKFFLRSTHVRYARHCKRSNKWAETSSSGKVTTELMKERRERGIVKEDKRTPFSFEYVGEDYNTKKHQIILCAGDSYKKDIRNYFEKVIDKDKCPVVLSGTAIYSETNNYETIARELGIRTEILFLKSNEDYFVNSRAFDQDNYIVFEDRESNQLYVGSQKDFNVGGKTIKQCVDKFKPKMIIIDEESLW